MERLEDQGRAKGEVGEDDVVRSFPDSDIFFESEES